MAMAGIREATRRSVSGLPREFWWLWVTTLINRLGVFVSILVAVP
jgi:hypothetical protein